MWAYDMYMYKTCSFGGFWSFCMNPVLHNPNQKNGDSLAKLAQLSGGGRGMGIFFFSCWDNC